MNRRVKNNVFFVPPSNPCLSFESFVPATDEQVLQAWECIVQEKQHNLYMLPKTNNVYTNSHLVPASVKSVREYVKEKKENHEQR